MTAKVFPDNTRIQIAYDTAGRVASVTDALGQVRQYGYVKDDRLLSVAYANAVNPTPSVTYSWDAFFPRLASMIDGIGTTTYAYHATGTLGAGKLATEAGPFGAPSTVAYIYDPLGRVLTRNAGGSVETFGYDTLGRSVSDANDLGTFRYSYLGQTAQVTDQTVDGGNYKLTYTYEPNAGDRRLKRIQNRNLLNLLDAKDYHYKTDAEGRITAETLAVSLATTFEYDDSDRLLSDKRAALSRDDYEYDDAGNLIFQRKGLNTWDATANANNQLSAAGGVAWTYDATGNLLNDGKRSYLWDAQYRLIQIKNLDTGSISDISYDGLDRRTVMSERASEGATPVVSRYLWCGEEICQRRNGADVVQALYFTQGEIKNGTSLFYAKDQLGSIKNVANKNGNWLGTLNYTAYGEVKQRTGQVLPDRQYAGMFQHAPSGLNLTWYRGYDPIAGRWLSRDPIGEYGGDNLYAYVRGNPVSYIDPKGQNVAAGAIAGGEIGAPFGPVGVVVGAGVGAGLTLWLGDKFLDWVFNESSDGPANAPPVPANPGDSPGEGWEWKGKGTPESGKGNWVNPETGQKIHPDLNHPLPKGPHWGLTNPDGSKWDYFPDRGQWEKCD